MQMGRFMSDVFGFIKSLNPIDILLYFAVVILIVLILSLIYIIKTSDDEDEIEEKGSSYYKEIKNDDLDLKEVMADLSATSSIPHEETTSYEEEQEEKAIISYEELLRKSKFGRLDYEENETKNDEITIKKVNLEHLSQPKLKEELPKTNNLFKYEKEEAFLKALKQLNELLN